MKLYHGSTEIVIHPEIRQPGRTLDYGSGFYTTTDFRQAADWAKRRLGKGVSKVYVNVYEADIEAIRNANTLWFDGPDESWVDFVYANRNDINYRYSYDFVYGPVANDRVYAQFALYEAGLIDKQVLIRELKTYKLIDQLLFHTSESLRCLSFVEYKEITL